MDNVRFKFKFKTASHKTNTTDNNPTVISKLIEGVCRIFGGDYKIEYNDKLYDITPRSHSLKGVERIFTKNPDKKGRYTCLMRSKEFSYAFPASSEIYSPFCRNHRYSGHLVKINDKLYFDMKEEKGIEGYDNVTF